MKTLKYIVLAVLLGLNLVSCDPPTIADEVNVEKVDRTSTGEEGEGVEDDDKRG